LHHMEKYLCLRILCSRICKLLMPCEWAYRVIMLFSLLRLLRKQINLSMQITHMLMGSIIWKAAPSLPMYRSQQNFHVAGAVWMVDNSCLMGVMPCDTFVFNTVIVPQVQYSSFPAPCALVSCAIWCWGSKH
jgi:hypothetical protein